MAGRDYGAPGSYFYPFKGSWRIPSTGKTLHKETPLSGKEAAKVAELHAKLSVWRKDVGADAMQPNPE